MYNDTTDIINFSGESVKDSLSTGASDSTILTKEVHAYPSPIHSESTTIEIRELPILSTVQPIWVPAILLTCFILLAWGRLFFRRRLDMIFRATFAKNYANQLIRDGNLFNERIGLVLFLIYLAVMAMFVYQAIPLFEINLPDIGQGILYLLIVGVFLLYWIFKAAMVKTLSLLFNTNEYSRELLANMYLFNLFAGMALLPIVSCMAYANLEAFFYIGLIIIALIYLYRMMRESIIGFTVIKFSVFHLILYLCTLEILPMIVLAKILTRNMIL